MFSCVQSGIDGRVVSIEGKEVMVRIVRVDDASFYTLPHRTSGPVPGKPLRHFLPFYRAYADGLPAEFRAVVLASDLQGREDGDKGRLLGVPVAEAVQGLAERGVIPYPNAVLLCGDLYDYPDCHKRGGTGEVSDVLHAFAAITPDVVAVLGNHDTLANPEALPENVTVLDGQIETLGLLRIGGVSGIIGSPRRNQRRTDNDFLLAMERVTNQSPDVLLLHQGPDDPDSNRRGDPGIALSLATGYSGLTVFGHSHWGWPSLIPIGGGQALNTDGRVVVVIPEPN